MRNRLLSSQWGFGVIELMVAIVVGLLVVALTSSAFVQNKMTYLQNERFARMQESGRAALDLLSRDLAMAGFWGDGMGDSPKAAVPITLSADCGTDWALNASLPVDYFKAGGVSELPNTRLPCVQDVSGKYSVKPGANALAIKHVAGTCVSRRQTGSEAGAECAGTPTGTFVCADNECANSSRAGHVYVRTDGLLYLSDGTASTFPPVSPIALRDWEYQVHLYFIGVDAQTGIPSLRRKTLTQNSGTPLIQDDSGGEFAEGVEYFHVQFGIDQTNPLGLAPDGVPDCYVSVPPPASCPGAAGSLPPGQAISARIYVLVRSLESDAFMPPEDPGGACKDDAKKFILGDVNVNDILAGGECFKDRFERRVYSTTVQLRNPLYMALYSTQLKAIMQTP